MDISTLLGIIFGFGMLMVGFVLDKGNPISLVLLAPAVMVFGGTFGATMVSFRLKDILSIPKLILESMKQNKSSVPSTIEFLVMLAEAARKEGLLSLERILEEEQAKQKIDPILTKGTIMVIDGTDVSEIRDRLETEIYIYELKKMHQASIFDSMGGLSPTMGVIGTVMGLVQVLSHMSTPEKLAESISSAFIATFYGVSFANLLYIPIASKLKLQLKHYKIEKEVIIDGLCGIRNGENPKVLRERLSAYLQFDDGKLKDKSEDGKKG